MNARHSFVVLIDRSMLVVQLNLDKRARERRMVRLATLGKIALGLTFPMVGAAYYTQYKVKCKIASLFLKGSVDC